MFQLTNHVANQPIADKPFIRHLQTADVFNECQDARRAEAAALAAVNAAMIEHAEAVKRKEAAIAKAKLMESMESMEGWD